MKLNCWPSLLLQCLANRLAVERFDITRGWANDPYLTRWTLSGKRYEGNGRAVFLHRFQRSDADELHNHPWPFVAIILAGGYWEVTPAHGWRNGDGPVKRRWCGPGSVLRRPAKWIHRVEIPPGCESWSLILRGRKEQSWGFFCPSLGYLPWRQHLANAGATGNGCETLEMATLRQLAANPESLDVLSQRLSSDDLLS